MTFLSLLTASSHLVFITRLLSLSKIRTLLGLRVFYTVRYIEDVKCGYTFEKYYVALPYKEGDVMLNRSSGQ